MRINFEKVKYKNILSTGNVFTTVELNIVPSTLIAGSNGSGKSTLLDAIVFGLYGRPFRNINKAQLVNSINNKELIVELYFSAGGDKYKILRGIKPNLFEIWKNGAMINKDASIRDYQGFLEDDILGINFKAFNQIVVLGSATYIPFMELRAYQRREIIEDLLDIQVFSVMGTLAKERMSGIKTDINENKYDIEMVESKIVSQEDSDAAIRNLKSIEVDKIKDKMTGHIDEIETKNTTIDSQDEAIKVLYDDIADKPEEKKKFQEATEKRAELERNRVAFEKELSFYEHNDDCPTCKQGIAHDFKQEQIIDKNQQKAKIEKGLVDIADVLTTHQTRLGSISKIEEQIQSVNFKISEIRAEIKMSKNALMSYKKELDNAQKEVAEIDTSKLENLQNRIDTLTTARTELLDEHEVLNIVQLILRDGGIKAKIISQYIPVINKLINKYLAAFDLFVDFQLDEEFNEVIRSRFRDKFTYASFSEGEKLRITLSIMLAWRSVAKLRSSVSTNLLILDETLDGALDGVGIESLIETLHGLNNDDNIFVISHRGDQFAEKFENNLKFEKIKNFSELVQ
jgi:DNA repair exonuclease SbcCD ATPase subunit|tara:strand:- start:2938 stop:4650 length:1713 start_codon:yes stop_codon:yes gene_type:complete